MSSVHQSKNINIPYFINDLGVTFMGKLMQELIGLTNPRITIFVPVRQTWYDYKTQGKLFCGTYTT